MYTKKEQRLLKKYEKEDALMYPEHTSDFNNPVREQFIKDLIDNEHFVKTNKSNDKKYSEPIKTTIKNLGKKDYITIVAFAVLLTTAFGVALKDNLFHNKKAKNTTEFIAATSKDVLTIVIILLAGILVGGTASVTIKQANQELAIEKFYQRMVVRLFCEFKKFYPELQEEMLQHCNPEMARVVKALILSNMPTEQVMKMQKIAMDIAEHRYSKTYKAGINDLKMREQLLKSAITIVESYLLTNPELKEVILDVYRGKIPGVFVLEQNQNMR